VEFWVFHVTKMAVAFHVAQILRSIGCVWMMILLIVTIVVVSVE